jgi:ribosomal protein L40E
MRGCLARAGGRYAIREVVVRGHTLELKFCVTCNMHRPLRASHCRECNRCVLKWDHHCTRFGRDGASWMCVCERACVCVCVCVYAPEASGLSGG